MDKTALTRLWFVPTSPRSPYKVKFDLKLLLEFDGKPWNRENQLKFAEKLRESMLFEGVTSEEAPDLSARDRLRAIKTFGFGYVDSNGILRITEAGRKLAEGENEEDLFLKQLLKWQFPSWEHGGMKTHAWRYPQRFMKQPIHPFFEVLRAMKMLGGELYLYELAIFLLPRFTRKEFDKAIEKIREFRSKLQHIKSKRERQKFIRDIWLAELKKAYMRDIMAGRIKTRETPTEKVEEFLEKKRRNSKDYADAAFRYFSYTGIVVREGNKLRIPQICEPDVEKILSMDIPSNTNFRDVDNFYSWLGNPNLPELPWEKPEGLRERIRSAIATLPEKVQFPSDVTLRSYDEFREMYIESQQVRYLEQLKADFPDNILKTYDEILRKREEEAPLLFEWNTWRAFLVLGDFCKLKPNFKMDWEFNPKSPAPAGKSDIEILYCGDFATLVEVTLTTGERQYVAEGEPVSRHVRNFEIEHGIQTFGLFIAPEISNGCKEFFYVEHKMKVRGRAAHITPISLEWFRRILRSAKQYGFNRTKIAKLHEESKRKAEEIGDAEDWYSEVGETIEEIFPTT